MSGRPLRETGRDGPRPMWQGDTTDDDRGEVSCGDRRQWQGCMGRSTSLVRTHPASILGFAPGHGRRRSAVWLASRSRTRSPRRTPDHPRRAAQPSELLCDRAAAVSSGGVVAARRGQEPSARVATVQRVAFGVVPQTSTRARSAAAGGEPAAGDGDRPASHRRDCEDGTGRRARARPRRGGAQGTVSSHRPDVLI